MFIKKKIKILNEVSFDNKKKNLVILNEENNKKSEYQFELVFIKLNSYEFSNKKLDIKFKFKKISKCFAGIWRFTRNRILIMQAKNIKGLLLFKYSLKSL